MVKVEVSETIDRPVEEVWEFINDVSKISTWDTSISNVKQTSTGPIGVGSTAEFKEKTMKNTISMRITEYEPNRKCSFEHTSGPTKGSILTFSLEPIDGKTRLTWEHGLKFNGLYKLLGPFMSTSRIKKYMATSLANAKRILETETKPQVQNSTGK